MNRRAKILSPIFVTATLLGMDPGWAQAPADDIQTVSALSGQKDALLRAAKKSPNGEAGAILHRYDKSWLLLMVRLRTGEAEVHTQWSDEIFVREGTIDLMVGGTLTAKHPFGDAPGEFHGASLEGGTVHHLQPGDVAHVAAGVPHWMKVTSPEPSVTLVVKAQ